MTKKLKTATLTSSLLELATASSDGGQLHNPSLRYTKFVFCDDKPNNNKQGVEYEDFPTVMASAVGTPIKMRFLGQGLGNHIGSIPIGHITDMTEEELSDGTHQLIADGILYAAEYPEEIQFLEEKFASNEAPGISWELAYSSTVIKNGINWFKGIVTRAATFVRNPAYASRTALLALASNSSITDEDLAAGLTALADEMRPKNPNQGGNNKVEEELKELKDKFAKLETELAESKTKVTELETANASLSTEKDELQKKVDVSDAALATAAREKLIGDRTKMVAEAGVTVETDTQKLAKKQEFWASMDETGFAEYVDDLKAAIETATKKSPLDAFRVASASARPPRVTFEPEESGLAALKGRMSGLTRTSQDEE